MGKAGLTVHKKSILEKVTKDPATGKLAVHWQNGEVHGDFEVVLVAVGESSRLE